MPWRAAPAKPNFIMLRNARAVACRKVMINSPQVNKDHPRDAMLAGVMFGASKIATRKAIREKLIESPPRKKMTLEKINIERMPCADSDIRSIFDAPA